MKYTHTMKHSYAKLLLSGAALVVAAPHAQAQVVGKLAVAQNSVLSLKPGATEPVKATVGAQMVLNEQATTEKASRAKFVFGEGALVTIGQNTTFKVSQEAVDQATGASTSKVEVQEGQIRVFVSRFWTGRPKVEIDTPTAVVGIKGSEVMVEVVDGVTTVTVFGGHAEVTSRAGAGGEAAGTATVTAGQQTNVTATATAPSPPVNVAPAALASLWNSTEPTPEPPTTLPAATTGGGGSSSGGGSKGSKSSSNGSGSNNIATVAAISASASLSGTSAFNNPAVEAARDAPSDPGRIVNAGNKAGGR